MKHKKALSLLLAALLLGASFASCSKDVSDDPAKTGETTVDGAPVEKAQKLTHVFRGTAIALPENYRAQQSITPLYDKESGEITVLATLDKEIPNEEDPARSRWISENHIVTIKEDGTLVNDKLLALPDDLWVSSGSFTADGNFIFLKSDYDPDTQKESFHVVRYNMETDEMIESDELSALFAEQQRNWFHINAMAVDAEGYTYLGSEQEILVLDTNFIKAFSILSSDWIDDLPTDANGTVYVSSWYDKGRGLCAIDKAAKALSTTVLYPDTSGNMQNSYFGEGYEFYCTNDQGLYGCNPSTETTELLMSYQNSNVTENAFEILKVIDKDTFLVEERDMTTYESTLAIYRKAEDIDLSSIKVVEIATHGQSDYDLPSRIVAYNKAHPDTRILVTDYSQYNTKENYNAGQDKMIMDILNGLYKPDVVVGYSDSELIRQLVNNDLYTDLFPYIDAQDTGSRDDLIGGYVNAFSKDGKLWAIVNSFQVYTLYGPKSVLGDRTNWTFTEMLDFASSLPAGTTLMENLTQTMAADVLFSGSGYGAFIDAETNTAHFTDPEFIRFLEYIKTLPAEIDRANRPDDYYETRYLLYHNGEIALANSYIYAPYDWLQMKVTFNTPELTLIGLPTSGTGEKGSYAVSESTYIILKDAQYPDEAWDFLSDMAFPDPEDERDLMGGRGGFAITKPLVEKQMEHYKQYEYTFDIDGTGGGYGTYDPENPMKPEDVPAGQVLAYFTDADADALMQFLDNEVGASASATVSDEIVAIINEEISSFTAGMRDAKATADIIQSRVSIWLAEHE